MASRGAILRGALTIPGGARPTPAPQGSQSGLVLPGQSTGQFSPLAMQLGNEGVGYRQLYGPYLPRPTSDFTEGAFSPFTPILPTSVDTPPAGADRPVPRRYQYDPGWNLPTGQPGQEGLKLAGFSTLQRLADVYSWARACVEYRKNQIRGIEWDITPTPDAQKAYQNSPALQADFGKRRAKALKFFKRPDRDYFSYATWISTVLEEVLVFDALSILMLPTWEKGRGRGVLGSNLASLMLISGPTIRPLVDLRGGTPRPPAVAYQQYLYGVPRSDVMSMMREDDLDEYGLTGAQAAQFRGDQLMYIPMVPRTWTPYGFPPIERALIPIMTGLQKQGYQYDFFSESTVPAAYVIPGDTAMTPNQLRELQDALNAIAGDPAWKQKIIVLPPNSKIEPQRPITTADELDELLIQSVCSAFGLSPMEIGVQARRSSSASSGAANQQAKMTKDNSEDTGLTPILKYLSDIFNALLQDVCGQDDMMFTYEGLQQEEDQEALTGVLVQQMQNGLRTIDECRQELNLQPFGLEESSEPLIVTPNGPVPLSTAVQQAQNAVAQSQAQLAQTQAGTERTQAQTAQTHMGIAGSIESAAQQAAQTQAQIEQTQASTAATHAGIATSMESAAQQAAQTQAVIQQAQATVAATEATTERTHAQTSQVQGATVNSAQQAQMAREAHQQSMTEQQALTPTAAAGAEGRSEVGRAAGPTPGHAAAVAANRERASAAKGAAPELGKRAAAEFEALARHLSKGRPITTWEPRFISDSALSDIAKSMAEGLPVAAAVTVAKLRAIRLAPGEYKWISSAELTQKAAGPNRDWPGWRRDLDLVKIYAPKIRDAFSSALGAVREFLAQLFSGAVRVTAQWAAQQIRDLIAAALRRVLGPLWTEGYALGQQSAQHVIAGVATPETSAIAEAPDWGGWQPGDFDAAARVADGPGLQQLLQQWGVNTIQSVSQTRLDDLAQEIAGALAEGQSVGALARRIEGMLNVPERAELIAQTELARATTAATLDTYHASGIDTKEWLVAPDERVCQICRTNEAAGTIPSTGLFPDGKEGPPGHPRCFPAGTLVEGPVFTAATQRIYDGDLITIILEDGGELTGTPNHPVLTPNGWIPLSDLHEGSNVLGASDLNALLDPDNCQAVTRIENAASFLRESGGSTIANVPITAVDFHGDGIPGNNVDIVYIAQPTVINNVTQLSEQRAENLLVDAHRLTRMSLRNFNALSMSVSAPFAGGVSMVEHSSTVSGSGSSPPEEHGLRNPAQLNVVPLQDGVNSTSPHVKLTRKSQRRLPCDVSPADLVPVGLESLPWPRTNSNAAALKFLAEHLDADAACVSTAIREGLTRHISVHRIIQRKIVRNWTGHVYNLETSDGWYLANGIIAHNCRCALVPGSVFGIDLSGITAPPLPGFNQVPAPRGAALKVFNPLELRNAHGEWARITDDEAFDHSEISRGLTSFKADNGRVDVITAEHDYLAHASLTAIEGRIRGKNNKEKWNDDVGVKFTRYALDREDMPDEQVIVATSQPEGRHSYVAGAARMYVRGSHEETGPFLYVDYLGTTGITRGAGTALAHHIAKIAAERGLPVLGEPANAGASVFWQKMGWEPDPIGRGTALLGWTAERAREVASAGH